MGSRERRVLRRANIPNLVALMAVMAVRTGFSRPRRWLGTAEISVGGRMTHGATSKESKSEMELARSAPENNQAGPRPRRRDTRHPLSGPARPRRTLLHPLARDARHIETRVEVCARDPRRPCRANAEDPLHTGSQSLPPPSPYKPRFEDRSPRAHHRR